jgi:putative membrane protein insertion efficiency factor
MRELAVVVSRMVSGTLILLVRAYQTALSPHIGNCCRFEPSCSAYCVEALRTHGVFRGCWLTFRRVMRCRPFGPSGYDPVPSPKNGSRRAVR